MATADTIFCTLGDLIFLKMAPEEHVFQFLLQVIVLLANYGIYVTASETGILRVVVIKFETSTLDACFQVLKM